MPAVPAANKKNVMVHQSMDSKNNLRYEQICRATMKKSGFRFSIMSGNYFVFFTFLGIFLPVGIQPMLLTNYALAQIDTDLINEKDKLTDISYSSSFTSSPASKSKLNSDTTRSVSEIANESSSLLAIRVSTELTSDSSSQADARSGSKDYGDFNGDGFDDLAIGVGKEDVDIAGGSIYNAGAVNIIYGSSNGLNATSPLADQFWTQNNVSGLSEPQDRFGQSLSSGDFNNDGFDDLAIGVPYEDVQTEHGGPTIENAGAVNVIYGSSNGLTSVLPIPNQFWTQNNLGMFPGTFDVFGESLSSGDFNGDTFDDLAIGVPYEDVVREGLTKVNAGAVNVIYGSSNGLSTTSTISGQSWTQDTAEVDDRSEDDDNFGESLTSGDFNHDTIDDLAIGVPSEDFAPGPNAGNLTDDGIVHVIFGSTQGLSATLVSPDQRWSQSLIDIEDVAERYDSFGNSLASGDFNGDTFDDLAIGVPRERVDTGRGSIYLAGAVNIIYGSSNGLSALSPLRNQFWTQDTEGVDNDSDEGDHFGWSFASGDFNNDTFDDLAIGVPSESLNTGGSYQVSFYGAVNVVYGSSVGLSATAVSPGNGRFDQFWTQNSTNVDDVSEDVDSFGSYLAMGDFNGDTFDDLTIGVPYEDLDAAEGTKYNAGGVNVLYGSGGITIGSGGLSATVPLGGIGREDQFWTQDSENVEDQSETDDIFGGPVA